MSRLGRGIQSTSFCCLHSEFKLYFELDFELNFFLTQKEKIMIIMIKNYLWAYVELKKKSFLHDKGVKKTSELENALLANHKICMQISLS